MLQSGASLITKRGANGDVGGAGCEGGGGLKSLGRAEELVEYGGSKKNFQKVLDDAAKADQNLASLLLTTNCESELFWLQSELLSI